MTEQQHEQPVEPLIIPLAEPSIQIDPMEVEISRDTTARAARFEKFLAREQVSRTYDQIREQASQELDEIGTNLDDWARTSIGCSITQLRPPQPQVTEEIPWRENTPEEAAAFARALSNAAGLAKTLELSGWDGWFDADVSTSDAPTPLQASIDEKTPVLGLPIIGYEGDTPAAAAGPSTTDVSEALAATEGSDDLPRRGGIGGLPRTPNMGVSARPRIPASVEMLQSLQTNIKNAELRLEQHTANPPTDLTAEELTAFLLNLHQAAKMAHEHYEDVATRGVEVAEEPRHSIDELAGILDSMKRNRANWQGLGHVIREL